MSDERERRAKTERLRVREINRKIIDEWTPTDEQLDLIRSLLRP